MDALGVDFWSLWGLIFGARVRARVSARVKVGARVGLQDQGLRFSRVGGLVGIHWNRLGSLGRPASALTPALQVTLGLGHPCA